MTEKELKKLSRSELLRLLIEQVKINEELDRKVTFLEDKLHNYNHTFETCGSLAEAVAKLSGIFEAADKTANEYISAVKRATDRELKRISENSDGVKINEENRL